MRAQLLAAALLAAAPAVRAERARSSDGLLSLWLDPPWKQAKPGSANVVLEARAPDGGAVKLSQAPFRLDDSALTVHIARWARRVRERGHELPERPAAAPIGEKGELQLHLYQLQGPSGRELHGFFGTPHGAYYVETRGVRGRALQRLLLKLQVEPEAVPPFRSLWPTVPLKTVLSRNGAFAVRVPDVWKVSDSPIGGPKQALSLEAGESRLALTPTEVPPDPDSLKAAAEATLQAALAEGAEGGPADFFALHNGLVVHFVELRWPKFEGIAGQVGAFFAYDGRAYSAAGANFSAPALRELLRSIGPPPPEARAEARRLAAFWERGGVEPKPLSPVTTKRRPSRPSIQWPRVPATALLLLSAALALLGSWLYHGEVSPEKAPESGPEEGAAPVPEAAPPETGPLRFVRVYFATPKVYEVRGPEGLRFVALSRRPLWLLRWFSIFAFASLWSWGRILGVEGWPAVQFLKLAFLSAAAFSLPAEALFGRRFRLFGRDGRLLLLARRAGLGGAETYVVEDPEGREVARLRRDLAARLSLKRWSVHAPGEDGPEVLVIEGDRDNLIRRSVGHFMGLFRDDLTVKNDEGEVAARSHRRGHPLDRGLLEYPPELPELVSTDILALSVAAVHIADPDRPHPWPFA